MEEDKKIKFNKAIKLISKIVSNTFVLLLSILASFLIYFIISTKLAEKSNETAPFGLYTIISESMVPSINVYDVVLVKKTKPSSLKEKDVITFYSTNPLFGNTPITHRIIEIKKENSEFKFIVKGDNNAIADSDPVIDKNVIGKVIIRFPGLGKVQYILTSSKGWMLIILLPAIFVILYDIFKIIKIFRLRKQIEEINEEEREAEEKEKDEAQTVQLNKDE